MFDITEKSARFLGKHLLLKHLLCWTWGIALTMPGSIATLLIGLFNKNLNVFHDSLYTEVGKDWGGLELGDSFVCCKDSADSLKEHELGHTFQNAIYGPFFLLMIWIPSALRYWHRRLHHSTKPYNAIWFENSATNIGKEICNGQD